MRSADDLGIFVASVQAGSFSAAASQLHLTRSAVSRRIQAIENRLGVRLLDRTTRRLQLTEAGQTLYDRGTVVLADLAAAEAAASDYGTTPRGTLRVSCLIMIALRTLIPLLPEFLRTYPGVQVQLDLSDTATGSNLTDHDVAICWGEQVDSALISTRLFRSRQLYCASPEYLDRHGVPAHPHDLAGHNCLMLTRLGIISNEWRFTDPSGPFAVKVSGNFVANSGDAQYEALLAGLGIARVTNLRVRDDVEAGRLRFVLEAFTPLADTAVYVMYRRGRHLPPKVRAFVTYLRQHMAGQPN